MLGQPTAWSGGRWVDALALASPPAVWPRASSAPTQRIIVPTRTNVASGMPSGKVRYAKLSSPDGGHINSQKETSPKSRTDIPIKAIACAFSQFLVGASLIITGCLLLAGCISKVEPTEAVRAAPSVTFRTLITSPYPARVVTGRGEQSRRHRTEVVEIDA
uniref:Uncharacterized protein n=1 Tax=Moschus moschiferus TaxID=68415 RepID=A0A8C6CW86_MOSMO